MFKLLAAAALALTPATSMSVIVPNDTDRITSEEVEQRALVCVGIGTGELDVNDVVKVYQLNTARKQRDFVLQCEMFIYGYTVNAGEYF